MNWQLGHRRSPAAVPLADRHYNRQTLGSPQFAPPGRSVILLAPDALWVSLWPFAEYVRHAWAGAWMCTTFRNESSVLSSQLINEAVAATRFIWGEPPDLGFVTFVDRSKTRPKRDPGYCYLMAGWEPCGRTKGGLYALMLKPEKMPPPEQPGGFKLQLALTLPE